MSNSRDFFLSVTERIFSNWTALKLAVEHGMGSREKAQYFCLYMTEIFYMNDNLDAAQVSEELDDFMYEEFDSELEDNSTPQVAEALIRFYRYCSSGDESSALTELEKLPPLQTWISTQVNIKSTQTQSSPQENESISEDKEASNDQMEVVADEWTTVKTRRKK